MSEKDEKLFDRRIAQRHVAKGLITQKEYDSHVKNLPDEKDNAELISISIEESEILEAELDREPTEVPGGNSGSGQPDTIPES